MMSGESEEDVITQVQNVEPEDPVAMTDQSDHGASFANETSEPAAEETNTVSSASCSAGADREEYDMPSTGNNVENNPAENPAENSPVEQTPAPADKTPACGASGHPPADDPCDDAENTDPGSISIPPSDAISQQESEISISQLVGRGRARDKSQQSMQAKLQEAIDKVEQLDRSLEKKLKENLEAKAVTADLRALVRRELAELSGARGGRHATREETDNTMQFLRVLVDNDSESETSSLVTPIFQTQVRFGREGPPRSAEDVHPGTQPDPEHPTGDSGAGEMPPPPPPGEHQQPYTGNHRQPHDQYFIRRNIELAQEAGGSLAMTEEERLRLEQLLAEDDDQLENAFSVDEQQRQLLLSLDDRLSSLGASASAPGGSSSLVSGPAGGGGGGDGSGGGGQAADGPAAASEQDYLEATRHDRETSARLENLHRRLERLAEPVEVRPLDRCDVDSMIQETITSLMSAPCGGRSDLTGAAASASLISVPSQTSAATVTGSEGTMGAPSSDGLPGAPSSIGTGTDGGGGGGGGPGSEAPTEATLDVRSVLSGTRLDENERQLAAELRPGSPSAWLVDVTQGQQRLQLVVPRLSRQLIASLLESGTVLPPDHGDAAGLPTAPVTAALSPGPRPVSTGAE